MLLQSRTTDAVREKAEEYKERSFTYGKIYRAGMQALSNGREETVSKRGKVSRSKVPNLKKAKSPREGPTYAHEEAVKLRNSASGKTAVKTYLRDA